MWSICSVNVTIETVAYYNKHIKTTTARATVIENESTPFYQSESRIQQCHLNHFYVLHRPIFLNNMGL